MSTPINLPFKLSVIVPVYNIGAYLPAFLDSLFAQTLDGLQIIVVNDGSTDSSPEILSDYQKQHPDMKVLHQANAGISVARNHGMELAEGEYITFPDGDDLLAPSFYETLYRAANEHHLDVALGNGYYYYEDSALDSGPRIFQQLKTSGVERGEEWLQAAIRSQELLHVVWLHIYRRSFIQQHALKFIPGLNHQDIPWTTEVLLLAERIQFIDTPLYYYRHRRDSISRQKNHPQRMRIARSYMQIVLSLDALIKQQKHAAKIEPELRWQLTDEGLGIYHEIEKLPTFALKIELMRDMRRQGIDTLILQNAQTTQQRWRAIKRGLKLRACLFASLFVGTMSS